MAKGRTLWEMLLDKLKGPSSSSITTPCECASVAQSPSTRWSGAT
jgi:hypothetical protein